MKRIIFFWLFCLSAVAAFSQTEICDDGIDNDGDGFIDCYDPDCANFGKCNGTFLGNDATCQVVPSKFPDFSMALDYKSEPGTTNNAARLAIGDLDRDGMPEIVTMNRFNNNANPIFNNSVTLLSGIDASDPTKAKIKITKSFAWAPQWEVAIANIKNDNCGEIFIWGDGGGVGKRIYKLDCQLIERGKTPIDFPSDPINFGLADFNGDGKVEIYVKDQIYDAETMALLVDGGNWGNSAGAPVAIDIIGDSNLELVIGMKIYIVDLNSGTLTLATTTTIPALPMPLVGPQYFIRNPYNSSSVADFNQDGNLDIIASGSTIGNNQNTTIFFYDVYNGTVKTFSDLSSFTTDIKYVPNGWSNGTGRVNIGDLDGDGSLDLSFVTGRFMIALDNQLNLKWYKDVYEETSGYTGCTLFDFNGDGKSEIVYRDESNLYILDGKTGNTVASKTCVSRTSSEYPFVADVDADGSTEICIPCISDATILRENISSSDFKNLYLDAPSEIRVYKSAAEPWVPARRVWNQHAYFNVNVNDDLTIPRIQQKHHLVFSTNICTTGANRPLNSFLNQSPYLNSKGCPTYASPDLAHVPNSLVVVAPTCPATSFQVSFKITNLGDISLNGNVPISFYNGDPTKGGAIKLTTLNVGLTNFNTGDVLPITNATITGPGSPFTLYIVLNDAGITASPISLPNTSFIECNYDNIISIPVKPKPVTLTAQKTDNLKCTGSTSPDNGSVSAFVPVGATKNTADYNFYWFKGGKAAVDATPDNTGSSYSGLAAGMYTVFAVHKTAQCSSDTVSVTVGEIAKTVTVAIDLISGVSDCTTPNGQLKAVVNNGTEPVTNFTYKWYEGNLVGTPGTEARLTNIATNLNAVTYTVLVTDNATGCPGIQSFKVPDNTSKPTVTTTQEDILCAIGSTGKATATVGGATAGFQFDWYDGPALKPSFDSQGSVYALRPAGKYTVTATNTTTHCISNPTTVTITQTTPPLVTASATAQQTSCDPTRPNGTATSSATGGSGSFSYEWFAGQNTLPANKRYSTASISGLTVGIYTVKVTDNTTSCSATKEVTVTLNNTNATPVISAVVAPQTQCVPYNGSITASVSAGNVSDYTFSWYNGTTVKATPDYPDTDNILSGLSAGKYTVKAINNLTFCQAAAKTFTIIDATPTLLIEWDIDASVLPSNCNSFGEMKVKVSAPGNTLGFALEWYFGNNANVSVPFTAPSNDVYYTATGLAVGKYTITATDLNSGCKSTKVFDLPFASSPDLRLISKNDILDCKPTTRGDIKVDLYFDPDPLKNPAGFVSSDFDLYIYQNENDPGNDNSEITPAANGPVFPYTTPSILLGDTYYTIVAVVNSSDPSKSSYIGCRTNPVRAEILKNTTAPVISALTLDPNTNCTGMGNGKIEASTILPSSFEWFAGTTASGTSLSSVATLIGDAGTYTVQAKDNATECKSEATYVIFDNPKIISLDAAGLTVTGITTCDAATGDISITDGGAKVTTVNENGSNGSYSPSDYTFSWTTDGITPVIPAASGNVLSNRPVGTYYVMVTQTASGCATQMDFEIKDETQGSPTVALQSFAKPALCVNPQDGFLTVVATALTGSPSFSYQWTDIANTPVGTNPTLAIPRPVLSPGDPAPANMEFTIKVTNTANNCFAKDTYKMPVVVSPIVLLTSVVSPITSCIADNGSAFATVINDVPSDYTYNWSSGATGSLVENLSIGSYTVIATDASDPYCVSPPQKVIIENMHITPPVVAVANSPLTNCDPIKANGVASASVNGDVVNYTFDWYAGTATTGTPIYTGYEVGGLLDQLYSVVAIDRITGCPGSTQVTITKSVLAIPNPQIVIISNVTSCIDDNGSMTASVGGNTTDYIFDWSVGNAPKTLVDYPNQITIDSLSIGLYTVVATSRATGCISGPDTDQIIQDTVLPEFDFKITPASCEAANGSASLIVTNAAEVASVEWSTNGELQYGFILGEVKAGTYDVLVTTELGCSLKKTIIITTDIRPFNGVSRNNDGRNDIFYINCIDNFPGNNVKIFNRAGTKVYEDDNYNNIDIYFDGKSNKGISPMGVNLPDGTYYYIIDKRDGSKPLAGYLELVN